MVKWCKNAGGKSCIELYRNGKLRYDGLSPEQTRRLEEVLESIPSFDPEAVPLPEDATVRAGLYHERFAQMKGSLEDWRKKKSNGNRHYAMCANEQGSGVRFRMRGRDAKLPHVRELCILQCQAVARWKNMEGTCYTVFENGKFTSTAAKRAMELRVDPASPEARDAFVGLWKGIDDRDTTIEAVIERVDPDGKVTGTACREYPNGALAWKALDEATFVNGDRVTVMTGKIRMTLMMNGTRGDAAETVMTSPNGWQRRVPMQPMSTTGCNERFMPVTTAASATERRADDAPIMGAWSGRWKNGTVAELAIEAVGDDRALTGRYCTRAASGVLWLWDIGAGGRFEGALGKKGRKALVTIPWGDGNRNELEFRTKGADKVTLKHRERAGTNEQKVTTVKMTRGASENGCLMRTTRSLAEGQG